jgi:hypothetical protein
MYTNCRIVSWQILVVLVVANVLAVDAAGTAEASFDVHASGPCSARELAILILCLRVFVILFCLVLTKKKFERSLRFFWSIHEIF